MLNSYTIKFFSILLLLSLFIGNMISYLDFFSTSILIVFLNVKETISLLNYFLVFCYLLFYIAGGYFFPEEHADLVLDMLLSLTLFYLGYHTNKKIKKEATITSELKVNHNQKQIKIAKLLIYLASTIYILLVAKTIYNIGLTNFYQGEALASKIENYANNDISSGIEIILNIISRSALFATILFYLEISKLKKEKIQYALLIVPLVIFPLINLERSSFIFGLLFVIVVYNFFKEEKQKKNLPLLVLLVVLSVSVASYVGNIRNGALGSDSKEYSEMITGEFSGIIAYQEIKNNINLLHYQYGSTIIPPLILKIIPRSFYPNKGWNSSGYYMNMLRPDEATKGYYLAPTLFGDVFLNFGYLGIIFILFFFGFASGHIDRLYFEKNSQGIFIIFTTFYTYYSILRNNLSDSLFFIFMIYVFFKIIKFFSRKIHQHENINRY